MIQIPNFRRYRWLLPPYISTFHWNSDLFLSVTSRKIFILADLSPDLSAGIAILFSKPTNIEPHTSHLRTQMRFVTPLSIDLEPDINKPTSKNIYVSSDRDPDISACWYSGWVIAPVFREPFLLNNLFWWFWKFDEGRKMSSQLWLRMAWDINYILSRYVFILSFISLTKYIILKLNNLMWLNIAG